MYEGLFVRCYFKTIATGWKPQFVVETHNNKDNNKIVVS
jgi:hypothetical protein